MTQSAILIVEDDPALQEALCDTLELSGYTVVLSADGVEALEILEESGNDVGMVISDVQMDRMDGHTLLKRLRARKPHLPVVLMTAYGTIKRAVEAMKDGAVNYIVKPFEAEVLTEMAERYLNHDASSDRDFVAKDPVTCELKSLAKRVAESDATVMISGESGTGKEVLARYIHKSSTRSEKPFVAINCAAIPENMLEAMLFGYEKGAFTGAYKASPGKFEQAHEGTLLLDEISEMDLGLQSKLLRVLQEREVERLGGHKMIQLNVRVLCTTNRKMVDEVKQGHFREDLYYRLNVFPLLLPALRDRKQDILPIAERMLERHCSGRRTVPSISSGAQGKLQSHSWPGNIRELDNVIQRSLILMTSDVVSEQDVSLEAAGELQSTMLSSVVPESLSVSEVEETSLSEEGEDRLSDDLKGHEERLILDAIKAAKGSRKAASERLGISPRTLRYKLARMRDAGIEIP
jgi:two-component system, response regulator FlrC